MYATVVTLARQAGIGNGLTYSIPTCFDKPFDERELKHRSQAHSASSARSLRTAQHDIFNLIGCLVKVPLRRKIVEGIVVDVQREKPAGDFDVKEIVEVVSDIPLLSHEQIKTAKWMAEYYVCTLRQALSPFLPGTPWSKLLPEKTEYIRIVGARNDSPSKGKKQQLLLDYLEGKDWVKWEEVKDWLGIDRSVIKRLHDRNFIEIESRLPTEASEGAKVGVNDSNVITNDIKLTPAQTAAHKLIKQNPKPTLLFGITGSGKTEIYAALIADTIKEGKSAILLLPEILLTQNFIDRFQQLVDRDAIAMIHSRLTLSKRREEWRRCHSGEVKLVIGSRSALFSPMKDLGLIIIDEEHEWTYKNEQSPRYHVAKVSEMLCDSRLILGSATPSVDSWYRAKQGDYQLVELPERYGGASLPSVQVVDLAQVDFGPYYPLSPTLVNAIRTRIDRHEQCVLFLNRRGFATSLLCMDCRYRFEDSETNLPYTVHHRRKSPITNHQSPTNNQSTITNSQTGPYLLSHHTGERIDIPDKCPKCGTANLREVGAGTQRIESLLEELFPSARILRADADTLKSPEQMRVLLESMKSGRADILLGTQSVVKGLDLPKVTLAAVLLADVGLSLPHFRAGERVFQLLTQLTGRSGRSQPGEVIIQTFRPNALEVELSARHDVRTYLERELEERKKVHYPPDTELIRFVFSGDDARSRAKSFYNNLKNPYKLQATSYKLSCVPSLFSGGKVWYVFLRGKGVRNILKRLPKFEGVIDVDPVECL
jgi:primosomal protein N' (replication factor Y) (superfamily II helicase)